MLLPKHDFRGKGVAYHIFATEIGHITADYQRLKFYRTE